MWPLAKDVREKILDYLESVLGIQQTLQTQDPMDGLGPRQTNPLLID